MTFRTACLLTLVLTGCSTTRAPEPDGGLLSYMEGTWMVVNDGLITQSCERGQNFAPAADRQSVKLTHLGTGRSSTYRVLVNDDTGLLLQIDGERRLTDAGEPVKWWVKPDTIDQFRWRREDWRRDGRTRAHFLRCDQS